MAGADVLSDRGGWILQSAAANNVSGTAVDGRACRNYGALLYVCSGNSAIFDVLASPNNSIWVTALSVTAVAGSTALLNISAFYPYLNVATRSVFSAAGGSANLSTFWQPGLH